MGQCEADGAGWVESDVAARGEATTGRRSLSGKPMRRVTRCSVTLV
jgi:hypothetical protein